MIYDKNDPKISIEGKKQWSPTQKFPASSYEKGYGRPSDQWFGSNTMTDAQFLELKQRQMALREREESA